MPYASKPIALTVPILLALTLGACPGPDAKQKALQVSLTALNTARDGFTTWDEHHQKQIVAKAGTYEVGKKALVDYRNRRHKVVQSFVVAYSALAAARCSINRWCGQVRERYCGCPLRRVRT